MSSYLITGATGYLGSMLIEAILKGEANARITGIVRNKEKAMSVLPPQVEVMVADILDRAELLSVTGNYDYVIHCAAVTQSKKMVTEPVLTADSIVLGTRNVLELAHKLAVKSMVYISSMEVYGAIVTPPGKRTTEDTLGAVDLKKPRSCYPMGKRMAEQYCYNFFAEYGLPVKVARLAQTFGRGVPQDDQRVFAQFARSAINHTNIVLHTPGLSVGNYCEIEDVTKGILMILQKGTNGEAYNVVNEACTMTIRAMAETVAQQVALEPIEVEVRTAENDNRYAADTKLQLSGAKLRELGWTPQKNLIDMYNDLIEYWNKKTL